VHVVGQLIGRADQSGGGGRDERSRRPVVRRRAHGAGLPAPARWSRQEGPLRGYYRPVPTPDQDPRAPAIARASGPSGPAGTESAPVADPSAGTRARRVYEQLAQAGGRRTFARQLVLDALEEDGGHLPAAEIHARVAARAPSVTLSTVYRTLGTLTDHGLVHMLTLGGEAHYGFADAPHHHAVCTGCGATIEVPADAAADLVTRLRDAAGFAVAPDGITFSGLCRQCQAEDE